MDQFPPERQWVVRRLVPVANSWPAGQLKVIMVPKAVSLLDAKAPAPACNCGQSSGKNTNRTPTFPLRRLELTCRKASLPSGFVVQSIGTETYQHFPAGGCQGNFGLGCFRESIPRVQSIPTKHTHLKHIPDPFYRNHLNVVQGGMVF